VSSILRLGVIGTGNIGQTYVDMLQRGEISRAILTAVSSRTPSDEVDGARSAKEGEAAQFTDYRELLDSGLVDAVLVTTPTMLHPEMSLAALARDIHLLVEKPVAMSLAQAQTVVDAARADSAAGLKVAVMLNQRFSPHYAKMRELIRSNAIGEITRVSWTMTRWYRPDVYYQVSSWRGTWPGEGGGLLINQCIHNLDILQWLTGLPDSVSAIAGFGKYHTIDVEDEFTATLTYKNGATGVVIASSGEAPGVNQLDIVGDNGMLRFDGDSLLLVRSEQKVSEHCRDTQEMFGLPEFTEEIVNVADSGADKQHARVLQNFVDAVLDDGPLTTEVSEGLGSLQLANGILLSAWTGESVALPLAADRYEQALQERIAASELRTPKSIDARVDMQKSFR